MYNCKNYNKDNGDTTVIGGKLIIEPGAEVEGLSTGGSTAWADITGKPTTFAPIAATTSTVGGVKKMTTQANSTATDVEGLVEDFNALLAKLKTAGLM